MKKLLYYIKEALRGFFQAKLMTFISIITIAVVLFFLGMSSVLYLNIQRWIVAQSVQPGVIVYLNDKADSLSAESLRQNISGFPWVKSIQYVGKQEAWNKFKTLYGSDMLDAVNENPFPQSLEIVLEREKRSTAAIDSIKNRLEEEKIIDGIRYPEEWIDKFHKIDRWFRLSTIPLIILFAFALHFTISNTIKLTIYARRDLIINMHFVGATDTYIKMPFILEGMIQGMTGGAIGITGIIFIKGLLDSYIDYWGPWYLPLIIFSIGVVFGCIGSLSATRKFLSY